MIHRTIAAHRPCYGVVMENKFVIAAAVTAVFVAGYVAMALDYVAHIEFGITEAQIRHSAVMTAALIGMMVVLDLLRVPSSKG